MDNCDENLFPESIANEHQNELRNIIGTAMTVTICPRACFDNCCWVNAAAITAQRTLLIKNYGIVPLACPLP